LSTIKETNLHSNVRKVNNTKLVNWQQSTDRVSACNYKSLRYIHFRSYNFWKVSSFSQFLHCNLRRITPVYWIVLSMVHSVGSS